MNGESMLQQRYERLIRQIEQAALTCGRDPGSIRLLAVSKTFPAENIITLADSGQRAFGESYLQEAIPKLEQCGQARPDIQFEWHFIGPIQSNKTRPIAENFDWVQSVDREKIARRLSEQRPDGLSPLNVCLQVNVSAEDSKSGCTPEQALELAKLIATLPRLRLRGLMAIPAPTPDVHLQRSQFAQVAALFSQLITQGHPLDTLSIGMSDDLESAIAEGSTMVRIGSALFGNRQTTA